MSAYQFLLDSELFRHPFCNNILKLAMYKFEAYVPMLFIPDVELISAFLFVNRKEVFSFSISPNLFRAGQDITR